VVGCGGAYGSTFFYGVMEKQERQTYGVKKSSFPPPEV